MAGAGGNMDSRSEKERSSIDSQEGTRIGMSPESRALIRKKKEMGTRKVVAILTDKREGSKFMDSIGGDLESREK